MGVPASSDLAVLTRFGVRCTTTSPSRCPSSLPSSMRLVTASGRAAVVSDTEVCGSRH